MLNFFLVFSMFALTACGTSGMTNSHRLSEPIAKNEARLMISRTTDLLYLAAAADVAVNGQKIASLGRGGSVVYDVPKGKNNIVVKTFGAFGQYSQIFDTEARKTYHFEISPNSSAMWPSAAFGLIVDAINAQVNENTGYFKIIPTKVE